MPVPEFKLTNAGPPSAIAAPVPGLLAVPPWPPSTVTSPLIVIPPDDPSEPCYEAETIELLKEAKQRAEADDLAWLKQHGRVYAAVDAA